MIEEVLEDFTGGVGGRFYMRDIPADRMWSYFLHSGRKCIFACTWSASELAKQKCAISPNWPCAVVSVRSIAGPGEPDGKLVILLF